MHFSVKFVIMFQHETIIIVTFSVVIILYIHAYLYNKQLLDKGLNKATANQQKRDVWNHILKILPSLLEQFQGNEQKNTPKIDILSLVAA